MKKISVMFFLISVFFLLGGCASLKSPMPQTKAPDLFTPLSMATVCLDNLSTELGTVASDFDKKVAVAELLNEDQSRFSRAGSEGSGVSAPESFRPFLELSIARLSNGYSLFDVSNIEGVQYQSAPPDFLVTGLIYYISQNREAAVSAEAYSIGLSGRVAAYDISGQVTIQDAVSRRKLVVKALTLRVYSASRGGSIFKLSGGELFSGDATFTSAPPVAQGLQLLSDTLICASFRELSTGLLQRSFEGCSLPSSKHDNSRLPLLSGKKNSAKTALTMEVVNYPKEIGVKILTAQDISRDKEYRMILRQFASKNDPSIPVNKPLYAVIDGAKIAPGKTIYFRKSDFDIATKSIIIEVTDSDQNVIGSIYGDKN